MIAYELKLGHTQRALQQASYNSLAFDRSYVVSASMPNSANLEHARQGRVGVIFVTRENTRVIQEAKLERGRPELRQKLVVAIRDQVSGENLV